MEFGSKTYPLETKSLRNSYTNRRAGSLLHVFNLKANFAPLWHSNFTLLATQNHQIFKKNHLRGPCENDSIFVSIFFLFRRPLGAHLAPNMAPLGAAKATQEAPLGPPGASLEPPWKPSGARRRPGTTQTPSRHRFWIILATILDHFC